MGDRTVASISITSELALQIISAATAAAMRIEKPMSIAIVDTAGHLIAFTRMDGAPLLANEVAQQKAWCAVAWDMPTGDWLDFVGTDRVLIEGVLRLKGITVLPGGHPIHVAGRIAGGIGVSGSHYQHDDEVARAGLASIAAQNEH